MQSVTSEEMTPDGDVSASDVLAARQRIGGFIKRTPLERNDALSERLGCQVYLKMELFQKTGAFKVRGAFNKLLSLTETQTVRGVVAVSGGNHGQGVAYAARALGLAALILVPEKTPLNYVDAMRGYGARVVRVRTLGEAFKESATYQEEGWYFIHPFDDPLVIAGQGTLGLEILDDCPQVTDVIVSVGGGGLAGGLAVAIKAERPGVGS
jgi:threonine dehydratase